MSENKNVVEMHGCIVCARTSKLLSVYTPDGRLVDCAVTSPGGHCVLGEQPPLVSPVIFTQQRKLRLLIKDGSPRMAKS